MKSAEKRIAVDYCVGCGLCEGFFGCEKAKLALNEKGFYAPEFHLADEEWRLLDRFCPARLAADCQHHGVWGQDRTVCLGYASDAEVRHRASSGGVLTALACFLLREHRVDGILQIGEGRSPWLPEPHVNTSEREVIECCGSRYVVSTPLSKIGELLKEPSARRYAVIGRPCDVRALRSLLAEYPNHRARFPYLFSFFCAGTPSLKASERMAERMGADRACVASVRYRGNGWPGFSTVTEAAGREYRMSYEESWGNILGRDLYLGCRFCCDGIGEAADISCGDAWYLNEDESICFDEREGRNVIFARTEQGESLLAEAIAGGAVIAEPFRLETLRKMQPYQYIRKAQLRYKLLAMRTMGKQVPPISIRSLKAYRGLIPIKTRMRMYLGTIRRVLKKRI